MGNMFVKEKFVDPYVISVDSTLLKAKGHLWHKSSMITRVVPHSGIDVDARWGFSHSKHWIFGYKLHIITSSTGSLIGPLSADFTQADIQDNQMYPAAITSSSLPQGIRYVICMHHLDLDHYIIRSNVLLMKLIYKNIQQYIQCIKATFKGSMETTLKRPAVFFYHFIGLFNDLDMVIRHPPCIPVRQIKPLTTMMLLRRQGLMTLELLLLKS